MSGVVDRSALPDGAAAVDLGGGLLAPGLVDAHAHLELSRLSGRVPAGASFASWLGALVEARRGESDATRRLAVAEGARRLLASGTTTVGDIDSSGAALAAHGAHPLRVRLYRELIDIGDARRRRRALSGVRRALPCGERLWEGLSPHAPYTASEALLASVARLAARRSASVTVHWAETEEETEWLLEGRGPLRALLGEPPRRGGLELLGDAGLLGRACSLVHGNHPARGDPELIARSGATLVHCPGSHRFFGRDPFPLERWRRAGVPLALGTDSLASNEDLDMRREMALLAEGHPDVPPIEIWRMASSQAAAALGLSGEVGELAAGARADFVLFHVSAARESDCWDQLVRARPRVDGVWVGGRAAFRPRGKEDRSLP